MAFVEDFYKLKCLQFEGSKKILLKFHLLALIENNSSNLNMVIDH